MIKLHEFIVHMYKYLQELIIHVIINTKRMYTYIQLKCTRYINSIRQYDMFRYLDSVLVKYIY